MAATDLIDQYTIYLRQTGSTERTVTTFTRTLKVLDRELPEGLDRATETELLNWLWRDGLKLSSRANYYSAMNGFFRWATKHSNRLDWDPTVRIERPKVPRGLPRVATDQQVRIIITEAAEPYRLWGTLASYAGLRCIEVHRAEREHITQEWVTVHEGKGGVARKVATHPFVWAAVRDLPAGPLAHISERRISADFLLYCQKRLYQRGLSMHRLRGWFATQAYRATRDLLALQKSLGHANPATTAGYVAVETTQLRAIADGLPTFGVDVDL